MTHRFTAGAGAMDITPDRPLQLSGYPHVRRISTGVHDPLLSSALFCSDGTTDAIFVANDVILIPRDVATSARERIAAATGVPEGHIMISATHTHSGPVMLERMWSHRDDPSSVSPDARYIAALVDAMVTAAQRAREQAVDAEAGLALADATGIGTNRRDPGGPADPRVPVLVARAADDQRIVAVMLIHNMHPTVLHEDSTQVSADFPGLARRCLQRMILKTTCPILHHMGTAGDQSPRHVVEANTFDEAERLGRMLAEAVGDALRQVVYRRDLSVRCASRMIELPRRRLPTVQAAEATLTAASGRLQRLLDQQAARAEVRTAECDRFGAEAALGLARAEADGALQRIVARCSPALVRVISIGPWTFVGWPGEFSVEFGRMLKRHCPDAFIMTCANGHLPGYIVTARAATEGGYEASNAVFDPSAGERFVSVAKDLIRQIKDPCCRGVLQPARAGGHPNDHGERKTSS